MSADIVDFQKREREDLIWICACGCSTHRHYSDGRVECASCNTIGSISSDGWRALLPALPDAPEDVPAQSFAVTPMDTAETFMRRRMKEGRQIEAVIILYVDGGPAPAVMRSIASAIRAPVLSRSVATS